MFGWFRRKKHDETRPDVPATQGGDATSGADATRAPGDAPARPEVSVETRAPAPGQLDQLDARGIPWTPVTNANGDVVAAYVTEGDLAAIWMDLATTFPQHGLWPVVAHNLAGAETMIRPWASSELMAPSEVSDPIDVLWNGSPGWGDVAADAAEELPEWMRPPARELAAATTSGTTHRIRAPHAGEALVVVPTTRPADAVARLGWDGAVNPGLSGGDISAVLRTWEDRYGAVLTEVGFDTLELEVAAPPQDADLAYAVGREHYAFCPDIFHQGVGDMDAYLDVVTKPSWLFWWD